MIFLIIVLNRVRDSIAFDPELIFEEDALFSICQGKGLLVTFGCSKLLLEASEVPVIVLSDNHHDVIHEPPRHKSLPVLR